MSDKKRRQIFYFTPEQEKQFGQLTVPGTNTNSNITVGDNARRAGVQALNFQEQEAARKDAEIERRSDRKTVKRKTTFGERLRGDKGYSSYMSAGTPLSGRDPLLGTVFDWTVGAKGLEALGKTALWNFAKYAPSNLFRGLAREYFINNAFKELLRRPILFEVGNTIAHTWSPRYVEEPATSLKFFERKPSLLTEAERLGIPKGERNFTPRWHVANYPGYLLKGLMSGSQLEKALSKNGTINIDQINAYFNKTSNIEREVVNKVLDEKFAGQKYIDYNLFKKAVLEELIGSYNKVPQTQWADYGMERLGFKTQAILDEESIVFNEATGEFELVAPFELFVPNYLLNTFTFESPRILYGNTQHFNGNPIGHSRTYTLSEKPNVLHVMESLSDWALAKNSSEAVKTFNDLQKRITELESKPNKTISDKIDLEDFKRLKQDLVNLNSNLITEPQLLHLRNNYLQRQLQENLRYAAESGLTKMRYPTRETAIKIEGYLLQPTYYLETPEYKALMNRWNTLEENKKPGWINKIHDEIIPKLKEIERLADTNGDILSYGENETILKKYEDFPKLFLKLYKGQEVRTVTDALGNTWYEVDVPKGFLNREWLFKRGGKLTINNVKI